MTAVEREPIEGAAPGLLASMRAFSTSMFLSIARVGGAGAGFLTQVVLARTLTADSLGLFFSATSAASVIGLIAAHGYPGIAARFTARYRERRKPALLATFLRQAQRETISLVAIAVVGVIAFALAWPGLDGEARMTVLAAALSLPAIASLRLHGSMANAVRRNALAFLPDTCIRPILLLAGVAGLVALGVGLSAASVTLLLTLIMSGLALTQYLLLLPDLPEGRIAKERALRLGRLWRREANPVIVVALFTALFADLAVLIATPLLDGADVAAVGICLKIALLIGFAVQAAHQVAVPELAEAHERKDDGLTRGALLRSFGFPVAFTLVATIGIAAFGDKLLAVFGPEYTRAHLALTILVAGQLLRALCGPAVFLITIMGAQKTNSVLAGLSFLVLVVANLALAPTFGVLGAAIAATLAMVFWSVASLIVAYRLSGVRTDLLFVLRSVTWAAR